MVTPPHRRMHATRRSRRFFVLAAAVALAGCATSGAPGGTPAGGLSAAPLDAALRDVEARTAPDVERLGVAVRLVRRDAGGREEAFARAGVTVGGYVPGQGIYIALPRGVEGRTLAPAGVVAIELVDPRAKVSPAVLDAAAQAEKRGGRVKVVVIGVPGGADAAAARIEGLGGAVLHATSGYPSLHAELVASSVLALAAHGEIRFVDAVPPPISFESERARAFLGATAVYNLYGPLDGIRGLGSRIGLFEPGYPDLEHPDFRRRVFAADSLSELLTPEGHTTAMTGLMAGSGEASSASPFGGPAGRWRGVAPESRVYAYFFASANPATTGATNYVEDLFEALSDERIDMANNSWGYSNCFSTPYGAYTDVLTYVLDDIIHGSMGRRIPFVFSAGNHRDGFMNANGSVNTSCISDKHAPFKNYNTLNYPKSSKNTIVVGAVDAMNVRMSPYSAWGPTLDGRVKPEVVSAGHFGGPSAGAPPDVVSASSPSSEGNLPQGFVTTGVGPSSQDPVYASVCCSSAAAALTTGALALLLDAWRERFRDAPQFAAQMIDPENPLPSSYRALLVHTALDLSDASSFYNPGPDYASGYGVVRVARAVAAIQAREIHEGVLASEGDARSYEANVPAGATSLTATLAWDDPAVIGGVTGLTGNCVNVLAPPQAADRMRCALVNDLDLVITSPSGVRHFPWTLDRTAPAADAVRTDEDHVNNLEKVEVAAPEAGAWTVTVQATATPMPAQDYSVALSVEGP